MDIDHFNITDLSRQVNELLREKKVNTALELVENKIVENPLNPFNYAIKGFIYSFDGDFISSRNYIQKALRIDHSDPEVLAKCAVSLRVMGRLDLVIELLNKIPFNLTNPGNVSVRFELLYSIMSLAHLKRRLCALRKLSLSDMFGRESSQDRYGFLLATIGDLDTSASILKAELLKNPLNPEILGFLGCIAIYNSQPMIAEEYLKLALQLNPNNSELYFIRGVALLQLAYEYEHYELAYQCFSQALELSPVHYPALEQRCATLMFLHRYKQSYQDFDRLYRMKREAETSRSLSSIGLAVLSNHWVTNIGHFWGLETFVKEVTLRRSEYKAGLLVCAQRPANPALFSYFENYIRAVTEPVEASWLHSMPEEHFWVSEHAGILSGSMAIVRKPLALLDEEWNQSGRGPLLTLRPDHEEFGWKTMESLGIPRGSWFVSFHARSMGFYEVGNFGKHNEFRNASIENYISAFKLITDRGGWILRMGDASMPKLPPMPGVIDYAHTKAKSDWMDVFLWAKCRFFLGTQSGPQNIPPMFGVPVVMVNMTSILALMQFLLRRDIAIVKHHWSIDEKRNLSFRETLEEPYGSVFSNANLLRKHRIELTENSPDEIEEAVAEMLQRLEGTYELSDAELAAQQQLISMIPGHEYFPLNQILGRHFLTKYQDLL